VQPLLLLFCKVLVIVKDDSYCIYRELLLVVSLMSSRTCYATCFALPSIATTIAEEMLDHLASVYMNPNRVRDAKHNYNALVIRRD
jgi:hypothetical protein